MRNLPLPTDPIANRRAPVARRLSPPPPVPVGSETEFDLLRLRPPQPKMLELGQACVHLAWHCGGATMALWRALADFMNRNRLDTMTGCASISRRDGGHVAASLWD